MRTVTARIVSREGHLISDPGRGDDWLGTMRAIARSNRHKKRQCKEARPELAAMRAVALSNRSKREPSEQTVADFKIGFCIA